MINLENCVEINKPIEEYEMKNNRIHYKTTQVKKVVTALVLLLVPVLIVACATSKEKATILPVKVYPYLPMMTNF